MDYSPDQSHSSPVKTPGTGVRDRVAQVYYKHGLFCSSHPYAVILGTLLFLAVCCYPLINIPLMGSSLQQFSTSVKDLQEDAETQMPSGSPRWFQGKPVGIVQQIIVKSAVSPWTQDLNLMDAFRGPLAEAFQIVETVSNFHVSSENNSVRSLSDLCLQVYLLVLPFMQEKQCEIFKFQQDGNIMKTIHLQKAETVDLTSPKGQSVVEVNL
ncbi:sterol regulatory element-binding protein cleavage-activating protein-like, partial [Limulus polyphemus]|uniref:Sterol regulatory element-binding protein cleavage-activating protein-like n=1 Tax=Limulus polyphemus TaxID=6850 RepID=A0ABM1RUR5_LIMPO